MKKKYLYGEFCWPALLILLNIGFVVFVYLSPAISIDQPKNVEIASSSITLTGESYGSSRVSCGNDLEKQGTKDWSCNIKGLTPGYNEVKIVAVDNSGQTFEKSTGVISLQNLKPATKVIVVAHPDDDIAGFGGMIIKEIRESKRAVKIIHLVSSNSGNGGEAGCCMNDPYNLHCFKNAPEKCNNNNYAERRMDDEIRALKFIGLMPEDEIMLAPAGYNDINENDPARISDLTSLLVNKLKELNKDNRISEIYTHHPEDGNGDHIGSYKVVTGALKQLGWYKIPIYSALIHYKSDKNDFIYPNPPCNKVGNPVDKKCNWEDMHAGRGYVNLSIRNKRLTMNEKLVWPDDIQHKANVELPIDINYRKVKLASMSQYTLSIGQRGQLDWNGFLIAFVKSTELFYKHNITTKQ